MVIITKIYLEKNAMLINFSLVPNGVFYVIFFEALFYIVLLIKFDVMDVKIQTVHFDADGKLVDYVTKKLTKLNTFHDRILKVDVFLKLDNVAHTIKDKIAEIRVHVPRQNFFVKYSSKSFKESFDNAFESLVNQVKRKKEGRLPG
jgi:putative sigma-54 modulation protein